MNRYLLLLFSKLKSIFQRNIAFSSRVEYSNVSPKAKVWEHCKLFHSSLGDYSYIGGYSRIIHADIGKFCSIAGETRIGMGTHTLDKISTSSIFTEAKNGTKHSWVKESAVNPFKRVVVGNDVWIGVRTMVMGGVKIGDGAVIGAGSIVTKDVPPYAVVAGVPAKVIRFRFPQDQIDVLLAHPWWVLTEEKLRKRIELFQDSENIDEKIFKLCHA